MSGQVVITLLRLWLCLLVLVFVDVTSERPLRRERRWLTGTKPPDVPCAFDPCIQENLDVCEDGLECVTDNRCHHHCLCPPESTHEHCISQGENSSTTEDTGVTSSSGNGSVTEPGTVDSSTVGHANITEPDTGQTEAITTVVKVTTESAGNNCPPGFYCVHGGCETTQSGDISVGIQCTCDEGWVGLFCDQKEGEGTPGRCDDSICDENQECRIIWNSMTACVPVTEPEVEKNSSLVSNTLNACSEDYVKRNKSERTCKGGLRCIYGVCVEDPTWATAGTCKCDPGGTGLNCQDLCCLECGERGECHFDKEVGEFCNCHFNYTGANCSIPIPHASTGPPEKVTWYLWVVGVCVGVLLLLIALLVILPYIMWRKRAILIMKIVYFFQGFEDEDDRDWDVFVSYKASPADEAFVVHTLYPKLEKDMGFKLHLHFRDFIPGNAIADNIIRAIKSSRRTLLVLSPSFISSQWTAYEYQVAQQEMLQASHRIIPLILEDISDYKTSMDPILKNILDSVTYLEWPGEENEKKLEKFWKRLQLSLPKKRAMERKEEESVSGPEAIEISVLDSVPKNIGDMRNSDKSVSGYEELRADPALEKATEHEEVYDTIDDADVKTMVLMKNEKNMSNGHAGIINNGLDATGDQFC